MPLASRSAALSPGVDATVEAARREFDRRRNAMLESGELRFDHGLITRNGDRAWAFASCVASSGRTSRPKRLRT
jgi:hypothetical protein